MSLPVLENWRKLSALGMGVLLSVQANADLSVSMPTPYIAGGVSVVDRSGVCVFDRPVSVQFTQDAVSGRTIDPEDTSRSKGLAPWLTAGRRYQVAGMYRDLTIRSTDIGFKQQAKKIKVLLKDDAGRFYFIEAFQFVDGIDMDPEHPALKIRTKSAQSLLTPESLHTMTHTPCQGYEPLRPGSDPEGSILKVAHINAELSQLKSAFAQLNSPRDGAPVFNTGSQGLYKHYSLAPMPNRSVGPALESELQQTRADMSGVSVR